MKNIKTILCGGLVAMLVSCSPQVTTTNYYFDSVNGDDLITELLYESF